MLSLKSFLASLLLPCVAALAFAAESEFFKPIVLDGPWRFMPAEGPASKAPVDGQWGQIELPGSWTERSWPVVYGAPLKPGTGEIWKDFSAKDRSRWGWNCSAAWFERSVEIPASWAGRRIYLDFARLSSDAAVCIDGVACGRVSWPGGELEIGKALKPGSSATIRLGVVAVATEKEYQSYMETAEAQVGKVKAEVYARGVLNSVSLFTRPQGAFIADVLAMPSTRRSVLGLRFDVRDCAKAGPAKLSAMLYGMDGSLERSFETDLALEAKPVQSVSCELPFEKPCLWDLDTPELYRLRLSVAGEGASDATEIEFGFREFWIDGRDLFLNGKKIRLRPMLHNFCGGQAEQLDKLLDSYRAEGFNFMEVWPEDFNRRGSDCHIGALAKAADRKGFLLNGVAQHMADFNGGGKKWFKEGGRDAYAKILPFQLKRDWNHPSIVMWGSTANYFGYDQDQNPRCIGMRGIMDAQKGWRDRADAGEDGLAMIKALDPTRPVFTHQGGYVGDIHTVNMYLNLIPLQEREEWLSEYARQGQMPFFPVEFGCPLDVSLTRARCGCGPADKSEPLMTEYCASYLGPAAFALESEKYRQKIRKSFKGGQDYVQRGSNMWEEDSFNALLELFISNTWRSWRVWGAPCGMLPWSHKLGTRRAGALSKVNGETLAWLAGGPESFASKDHHFASGSLQRKQAAIINDTRSEQPWKASWRAELSGAAFQSGVLEGRIGPGESLLAPFEFKIPDTNSPQDGRIVLAAQIGGRSHEDSFAFRAYPAFKSRSGSLYSYDPEGSSSAAFKAAGFALKEWRGSGAPGELLLIGRRAFENGGPDPAQVEAFVRAGGRLIIMAQDPQWLESALGFRASLWTARRFWPLPSMAASPSIKGLDAEDFRDWNGAGSLLDPKPDYFKDQYRKGAGGKIYSGWRWGNSGSVASCSLEKPHHSSWTPLLEGDFDLAYSPLMRLDYGKGLALFCGLDLEGRSASDPLTLELPGRLVEEALSAKPPPRLPCKLLKGSKLAAAFLRRAGVDFEEAASVPASPCLLVADSNAAPDKAALEAFVSSGGKLFFLLDQSNPASPLAKLSPKRAFHGSSAVPSWPECAGLSLSDLRLRADLDVQLFSGDDGSCQTDPEGLLAKLSLGKGCAVMMALSPDSLPAAKETFFRFSQWRLERAASQLLANLGASFAGDSRIFLWRERAGANGALPLAGDWSFSFQRGASPGSSLAEPGFDDSPWSKMPVPLAWTSYFGQFDGAAWLRREVKIPKEFAGKDLVLNLGKLDDEDVAFFNGVQVGSTGRGVQEPYSVKRTYQVPGRLVKEGANFVAVRIWDSFGNGGVAGDDASLRLESPDGRLSIPLSGEWLFKQESRLEPASSPERRWRDPGRLPLSAGWESPQLDCSGWLLFKVPAYWEDAQFAWPETAWYRLRVDVPESWKGQDLVCFLGRLSGEGSLYFNGKPVELPSGAPARIDASLVRPGTANLIALKLSNCKGRGGVEGLAKDLLLLPKRKLPLAQSLYHPDYMADFEWGDNPFRYYRW